ncbi:hypothetical protein Y88_2868 [Novosphingobium nitrogenifigens DSM 19370]|uniref:Uncharacterized protein n=1 Tax=Novosphingobium nitrogenifigens DSM 19370 TaxID=983920 RepID=F1Z4G8_9SPHN|nr:hypothetical protein Y88_2868 [Novosphingobium nitrogenifigens DSM 19370]
MLSKSARGEFPARRWPGHSGSTGMTEQDREQSPLSRITYP